MSFKVRFRLTLRDFLDSIISSLSLILEDTLIASFKHINNGGIHFMLYGNLILLLMKIRITINH